MVDWWALGILIYEIVVGAPPYNDRNHVRVMQDILRQPVPQKDYFTKEFSDLLEGLLEKNPALRFGSERLGGVNKIKTH